MDFTPLILPMAGSLVSLLLLFSIGWTLIKIKHEHDDRDE